MGRQPSLPPARCPDVTHRGSRVKADGTYNTTEGRRRRYRCTPLVGKRHSFSLVLTVDGPALAGWTKPPACPREGHEEWPVVRNGTYGKRAANPRQRYLCTPGDGEDPHAFTPPLPRDHVHVGEDQCGHCDELRGVHHGEAAVARRHSWSSRIVARGLEQLSRGASYAEVGRWALRVGGNAALPEAEPLPEPEAAPDGQAGAAGTEPVLGEAAIDPEAAPVKKRRRISPSSKASHSAWHIAAGWTEAFAPVVYAEVEQRLRERAVTERARLDARLATGLPLDWPQVLLLDDLPVYGREVGGSRKARRDDGFYVLVAAEVSWSAPPKRAKPAVGLAGPIASIGEPPTLVGRQRLRLVRTLAKSNASAWRLLFDELGYAPDFVVADAGTGITAAVDAHFDPGRTRFVPSLWHVGNAVRTGLSDTPGAFVTVAGLGKQLRPELATHLKQLQRDGALASATAWKTWWDELEDLLVTLRLPRDKTRLRRRNYEAPMAAVLPHLLAHPAVPVSTGGLEKLIDKQVNPLLAMRRSGFGNIERTNNLFDLVVAREHEAFDDLSAVAALLRGDASPHGGWTVPLRAVADPRPRGGRYSSLRDATLLASLASERGLA